MCGQDSGGPGPGAGEAQGLARPERLHSQRDLPIGQTAGEAGKPIEDSTLPARNDPSNLESGEGVPRKEWDSSRKCLKKKKQLSEGEGGRSTEAGQSLGLGGEKVQRSWKERPEARMADSLIKLGAQKVADGWVFSQDSLQDRSRRTGLGKGPCIR